MNTLARKIRCLKFDKMHKQTTENVETNIQEQGVTIKGPTAFWRGSGMRKSRRKRSVGVFEK